jgi:uncharacterized protein (TIGR00297 family)
MKILPVPDLAQTADAIAVLDPVRPVGTALIVTLLFAGLARWVRGVSRSGAIAGAVVCFLLYLSVGPGAIAALVSVFALTWISTRLGYQQKRRLGTAEKRDGRTAMQVLANLAVATSCAGLSTVRPGSAVFLVAASAALSEAAADTISSEVGQARSAKVRLITTWKQVAPGTDGGVSWAGTLAGIAAAIVVSLVCVLAGLAPLKWLGISVAAAVAGMTADSYLGALLERRKLLRNDAVNFLGTLIAAGAVFLMIRSL